MFMLISSIIFWYVHPPILHIESLYIIYLSWTSRYFRDIMFSLRIRKYKNINFPSRISSEIGKNLP